MANIDFARLDLRDALDLAILIEEEAKERYETFTKIVGGRYKGDASDVFKTMAGYEAKHGAQLAERRKKLFGNQPVRVFMSARQAFEVALASEEKAHDFFVEALRHVKDAEVKTLFQELRDEEVEHRNMIAARLKDLPPGPDVEEEDADAPGSDAG